MSARPSVPSTALDDINLGIRRGRGVVSSGRRAAEGPLLRIIAGLEVQTSGEIWQGGRDISRLPPAERDYGIVFQSYALFPNLQRGRQRVVRARQYGACPGPRPRGG